MGIRNLLTVHADVQADHLREVMAGMERLGPPRIRVIDLDDSLVAIEGTHRLAAAELLGLAPEFEILDDDERIDVSDLDADILLGEADGDGTMRALDIAWTLRGAHNGEYFVGQDGRLDVIYRHIKGDWDGPARRQPTFDELVKAASDKTNQERQAAYDRLCELYPREGILKVDGTPLTENDEYMDKIVAFDPASMTAVWGGANRTSVLGYDEFVRKVSSSRISSWTEDNSTISLDVLAGHVADYLRHGGKPEDHYLLRPEDPKVPAGGYDHDFEWEGHDNAVRARRDFHSKFRAAVGNQDLSYGQCLDVLSAKVQAIMAPKVSVDIEEMVTGWTRAYNNGEAGIHELAALLAEHGVEVDAVRHLLPEADGEDGCRLMDAWLRFGDGDPILITHHGDALLSDGDVSQLAMLSSCESGMHGDLVAVEWDVVKGRIEHALDVADSADDVERLESWLSSVPDMSNTPTPEEIASFGNGVRIGR